MIATHSKVNKSWKVNREVKQGQCESMVHFYEVQTNSVKP